MEVSNNFKNKIKKMGRQLDVLIAYPTMFKLITEDEKLIITQDSMRILTEQMSSTYDNFINGENINKLSRNNLGELFRTYMKSFDIETTEELYVGQNIQVSVGVKEEQDNDFEYLNYGTFYVYEKKYNEDTKTYSYVVCDKMIFTMIPFKLEYIIHENETEVTIQNAIARILNECGIDNADIELTDIVNGDKVIYKETFEGLELTCRDVLDMIMQTTGSSLVAYDTNDAVKFTYKTIGSQSVETINEDILSNNNLSFTKKFGKINSLLFSRASGTDNIERKDTEDISVNGYCQYVIEDNLIIDQTNREDFIDDLFDAIKDTEYYICDFVCTGLAYIEYLDAFNVQAQGNTYNCVCLKNTFTIQNGLEEEFKSEKPKQIKQEYTQGGKDDKTASIIMDKLKGEIVLKTYVDSEDGKTKLSQVRLDSSGEEGSLIEIGADNIKLEGTTTINERFKIDNNGYMYAKAGGEIAGWKIKDTALYKDVSIGGYDYRVYIQSPLTTDTENSWIFSTQKKQSGTSGYSGTAVIQLGGNISGKDINASGNLSVSNKLAGYLNLNDAKSHYIGEYGMYFTDETFDIQGITTYTRYTNNKCCVNGQIQASGYAYALNFYPTSSEEFKKNIKLYKIKALDIIKDTDIYTYNFKTEDDKDKKHIGFVIGDKYKYREELTNSENQGVDLYSFVSVCCKAIQEQQEQIDELKKEIENLKGGNK